KLRRTSVADRNANPVAPSVERFKDCRESSNLASVLSGHFGGHGDEETFNYAQAEAQAEINLFQWPMIYFSTALRLGVANAVRALVHRACKLTGIYQWLLPSHRAVPIEVHLDSSGDGDQPRVPTTDRSVLKEADELLSGKARYFSVHVHEIGNPP